MIPATPTGTQNKCYIKFGSTGHDPRWPSIQLPHNIKMEQGGRATSIGPDPHPKYYAHNTKRLVGVEPTTDGPAGPTHVAYAKPHNINANHIQYNPHLIPHVNGATAPHLKKKMWTIITATHQWSQTTP